MTIIFGPPGTGKTSALLEYANNCDSNNIGMFSFSRRAARELRTRYKGQLPAVQTIHSLCFGLLKMRRHMILQPEDYTTIGESINLRFSSSYETEPTTEGDKIRHIEQYSRNCQIPVDDAFNKLKSNLSRSRINQYAATLKRYKEQKNLFDFTDLLELSAGQPMPHYDLLLIDEAQDLSPLQWRIVNRLRANSKRSILAGDDDQAIYEWAGADIVPLLAETDSHVLNRSYRIPREIRPFVMSLAARIKNRANKEWISAHHGGSIQDGYTLGSLPLDTGEWLILTRTRYQMLDIRDKLVRMGYSYILNNRAFPSQDLLRLIIRYEKQRQNKGNLTLQEQAKVKELTDNKPGAVWYEAFVNMKWHEKQHILNILREGRTAVDKPRITVSTIHGAKGAESENVAVLPDMSTLSKQQLSIHPDSEHRVWYVAVSRAKANLYLMIPQSAEYYRFPEVR